MTPGDGCEGHCSQRLKTLRKFTWIERALVTISVLERGDDVPSESRQFVGEVKEGGEDRDRLILFIDEACTLSRRGRRLSPRGD